MALSLNGRILNPGSPLSLGGRQVRGLEIIGGGGGGGGYATVQEGGVSLPARTILNFGAGLTASDNAGSTRTDVVLAQTPVLNNFAATVPPAATDDSVAGYAVGSRWINVTTNRVYVCVDATATAAIWQQTPVVFAHVLDPELPSGATGALPASVNNQFATAFIRGADTNARYRFLIPPWYKGGTIRTRVFHSPDAIGVQNFVLALSMEAQALPHDMGTDSFATAISTTVATSGVVNQMTETVTDFTNAQADNAAPGDMVRFNVQRTGTAGADVFLGVVHVYGVVIEEL